MGERVSQIAKVPEVKQSSSNSRVRRTERLQSMDTPVDRILYLQRTVGNQAVSRLMRSGALQAKLRIGQPGDVYEQEADRVADAVMRMPEPGVQRQVESEEEEEMLQVKPLAEEFTPLVQRQVDPEEEEEEFQAKATSGRIPEVNSNLESQILSLKGGGKPLPESERAYFEPRFGVDFSQVRLHSDAQAAESARAVNAKAYTLGQNVVFGTGEYTPGTSEGRRLMAHELTHIVQQNLLINGSMNQNSTSIQFVAPPQIQRDCQHFDAGWIHPRTGKPAPEGTWCEEIDEARAIATACPSNCFIYSDGPTSHPHRPIPGFPCAHYVAHELGIKVGERNSRCSEGYSVTITQITQGRGEHPLNTAQVGDIWSDGGHSGVVRRVDLAGGRILIEACSIGGEVYRDWESNGNVYR